MAALHDQRLSPKTLGNSRAVVEVAGDEYLRIVNASPAEGLPLPPRLEFRCGVAAPVSGLMAVNECHRNAADVDPEGEVVCQNDGDVAIALRVGTENLGHLLNDGEVVVATPCGRRLGVATILSVIARHYCEHDSLSERCDRVDDVQDDASSDSHSFPAVKVRLKRLHGGVAITLLDEITETREVDGTRRSASMAEFSDSGHECLGNGEDSINGPGCAVGLVWSRRALRRHRRGRR